MTEPTTTRWRLTLIDTRVSSKLSRYKRLIFTELEGFDMAMKMFCSHDGRWTNNDGDGIDAVGYGNCICDKCGTIKKHDWKHSQTFTKPAAGETDIVAAKIRKNSGKKIRMVTVHERSCKRCGGRTQEVER